MALMTATGTVVNKTGVVVGALVSLWRASQFPTDANGKPVFPTITGAKPAGSPAYGPTLTDANGNWSIASVAEGKYFRSVDIGGVVTWLEVTYTIAATTPKPRNTEGGTSVVAGVLDRLLVAVKTKLVADLAPADTTIHVADNTLASGDRVALFRDYSTIEFLAVTSAASASTLVAGAYQYTVTRNLNGAGAQQWYVGDVVCDTGTTNTKWLELRRSANLFGTGSGPALGLWKRNSATWNDATEQVKLDVGGLTFLGDSASTAWASWKDASDRLIGDIGGLAISTTDAGLITRVNPNNTFSATGTYRVLVKNGTGEAINFDVFSGAGVRYASLYSLVGFHGLIIGNSTNPSGALDVRATATNKPTIVAIAVASQTANQIEVRASDGTTVNFAVDIGGDVYVTKSRAAVAVKHGGANTAIGRMAAYLSTGTYYTHNLGYDGSNWNLDDTGNAGAYFLVGYGTVDLYVATAGSNPRTPSGAARLNSTGLKLGGVSNPAQALDVSGNAVVSGTMTINGAGSYFGTGALVGVNSQMYGGYTNFEVQGNRSAFAANSEVFVIGLRYNNGGGTAACWIGASNSTTPSFVVNRTGGNRIAEFSENGNAALNLNTSSTANEAGSYGGGVQVIFIADRNTAPSSNPSGGGILYAESGALKWRGSSGTVTTIANA
jgi:hypothetical protein